MIFECLKFKQKKSKKSVLKLSVFAVIFLSSTFGYAAQNGNQSSLPETISCRLERTLKNGEVEKVGIGSLEMGFQKEGSRLMLSRSGFEWLVPDMSKGDFILFKVRFYDKQHPEKGYEKDYSPRIAVETSRKGSDSHLSYRTYFYPVDPKSTDPVAPSKFEFSYPIEFDPTLVIRCQTQQS